MILKRWKDEVEPIVGKTDMFVFPHGAQDRHTQAYDYLVDEAEFKFIAGVRSKQFYRYISNERLPR